MINNVLNEMIKKYNINSIQDETNAIKEIVQEIVLCALSRSGFFNEAAFYGGTALRIFYGLDRFSEDLDFSLLKPDKDFMLDKYFDSIENEMKAYGIDCYISKKEKVENSNIETAFVKGESKTYILNFFGEDAILDNSKLLKDIKVKFEVDVNPAKYANTEVKYKLLPSPHEVRVYDKPSLFAGKIHAILCRNWKSRTKGRDLYDYIFYLSMDTKVNIDNLREKLINSNVLSRTDEFDINILKDMLYKKFDDIDFGNAKDDVRAFIKDTKSLDVWNKEFFKQITTEKLN